MWTVSRFLFLLVSLGLLSCAKVEDLEKDVINEGVPSSGENDPNDNRGGGSSRPRYADFLFSKILSDDDHFINDSSGNEWSNGGLVVDDEDGSMYVSFFATNGLSYVSRNYGGNDIGVIKMSPYGAIEWSVQFTQDHLLISDSTGNEKVYDIKIGPDGFLYILATSNGDFAETNAGGNDLVLIKMKKNSDLVWVKQLGDETLTRYRNVPGNFAGVDGSSGQIGEKIIFAKNKIYVYGKTGGNFGEVSAGSSDVFFTTFDTDGNLENIKQWGSNTLSEYAVSSGQAVDGNGDVYPADFLYSSSRDKIYSIGHVKVNFLSPVTGDYDPYIAEVDPDTLKPLNVIQFSTDVINDYRAGQGLAPIGAAPRFEFDSIVQSGENLYIGARTSGTIAEGGGGNFDAIVLNVKVDLSINWIKQFGATHSDSTGIDLSPRLVLGSEGRLYSFFGSQSDFIEENAGGYDCVVAELSQTDGSMLNSLQLGATTTRGGANSHEWCYSMSGDKFGNLYLNIGTESKWGASSPIGGESILIVKLNKELGYEE